MPSGLKRDLKPGEGVDRRRDVAQRPAGLKPPQLVIAVEEDDIEAPNPRTVEAKCKAQWPPQGQATECKHGPARGATKAHSECLQAVSGNCKPEGKPTALKSAAPGHLEGKMCKTRGSVGSERGREQSVGAPNLFRMFSVTRR
jgi:hypothetical protein